MKYFVLFYDTPVITKYFFFLQRSEHQYYVITLLFVDGLLNWLQNIFAFTIMSMVSSLTFAVANASKRIFIIFCSLLILGNPVTSVNVFGMMMAVLGVLLYNKVCFLFSPVCKFKYDNFHSSILIPSIFFS